MNARYYDTATGTFLTRDTYPATAHTPSSLNRYAYAYNNPVNLTDPTGQSPEPCGGGSRGIVGAISWCFNNLACNLALLAIPGPDAIDFGADAVRAAEIAENAAGINITDKAITHIAKRHLPGLPGASTFLSEYGHK
jgi:hypothetical protein